MAITIGNNIASIRAQRQLGRSTSALSQVNERLASGQRINRAADDAAGLAIADSLRADQRILTQGVRNVSDGISMVSIASEALGVLGGIVTRQTELAAQSANGVFSSPQRWALQEELNALANEYNRIVATTSFNGISLLDARETRTVSFQVGRGEGAVLEADFTSAAAMRTVNNGQFSAPVSFAVGAGTYGAHLIDLNGNGQLDWVSVGGPINQNITVRMDNGSGGFGTGQTTSSFGDRYDLATGDFNGDSNIDIAIPGPVGAILFAGNGNGSFGSPITVSMALQGSGIGVTDLNRDGSLDLVVSVRNSGGGTPMGIFLGNGNGTFVAPEFHVVGGLVDGIEFLDINGNDTLDILVADKTNGVLRMFLNNGNGTFTPGATYATGALGTAGWLAIGDIDGDAKADVLVGRSPTSDSLFFRNNGNGTLTSVGSVPEAERLADLNGDGNLDSVVATGYAPGNGDGTFGAFVENGNPGDWGFALGDVNGDSLTDFVTVGYASGDLFVMYGLGDTVSTITPPDISTLEAARAALETLSTLQEGVARARGNLGAIESRLAVAMRNLQTQNENYAAAESSIREADVGFDAARAVSLSILQ